MTELVEESRRGGTGLEHGGSVKSPSINFYGGREGEVSLSCTGMFYLFLNALCVCLITSINDRHR